MLRPLALVTLLTLATSSARAEVSVSLDGSRASMERQNEIARQNDYSFLRTGAQVMRFVDEGYLVPLEGNADYQVDDGVSYPYARPEMRLFIERLAAQHRDACGLPLVVTSLTRPMSAQPRNSHALSVHPTGMAVDLRVSGEAACRGWLEESLLALEARGLLDVTREHRPPHFHVALFTDAYREYALGRMAADDSARAEAEALEAALAALEMPAMQSAFLPPPARRGAERPEQGANWAWLLFGAAALGAGIRQARSGTKRG